MESLQFPYPRPQPASLGRPWAFGPRLLLFSGGTALKDTAKEIANWTRNSIHLITPFDSGGSSAALRHAFSMPAVGDIRARILALADKSHIGAEEACTLFAYRLPDDAPVRALAAELVAFVRGRHPLLRQIPQPMKGIIQDHLAWFSLQKPADFPLNGACIGNLVLAAGYLRNFRRINPVAALFCRMVRAKGVVRSIVEDCAHLAVRLASGRVITGQHNFTGKSRCGEASVIDSPVEGIWLSKSEYSPEQARAAVSMRTSRLIHEADCICYPIGSFYSSVVANLLPVGVGRAVTENPCPKVFVPNLGNDPELLGHTLEMQVRRLLAPMQRDAPRAKPSDFLTAVLLDPQENRYPGGVPHAMLEEMGIQVRFRSLESSTSAPLADARLLSGALEEFCSASAG